MNAAPSYTESELSGVRGVGCNDTGLMEDLEGTLVTSDVSTVTVRLSMLVVAVPRVWSVNVPSVEKTDDGCARLNNEKLKLEPSDCV